MKRKGIFWEILAGTAPTPGALKFLGWEVLDAEPGRVRARFRGRPEFYNPAGFVQGGFLAAMLDGVMGAAVVSSLDEGENITTLDMNVSYMRSIRDVAVVGEGRIVQRGGSVIFMEGDLRLEEDDALVARATATGRVVPLPSPSSTK